MTDAPPTPILRDRRHPTRQYTRAPNFAPEELVRVIAARLQRVCAHFPPEDFERMVRRIAHVQWKYDRRAESDPLGLDQ